MFVQLEVLCMTGPDIAYAIVRLARYHSNNPGQLH